MKDLEQVHVIPTTGVDAKGTALKCISEIIDNKQPYSFKTVCLAFCTPRRSLQCFIQTEGCGLNF